MRAQQRMQARRVRRGGDRGWRRGSSHSSLRIRPALARRACPPVDRSGLPHPEAGKTEPPAGVEARCITQPVLPHHSNPSAAARPPLIGVVTHELRAEPAPAWAPAPGRTERDLAPARLSLRLSYTQALQEAGAIAVVLPAHGFADDAGALLDRLDGLLFSGGPDLDPATYGRERRTRCSAPTSTASQRRVRARAAARRDRPRPADARDLPRHAGAQRLPRRHAAPAPARPHRARAPPDAPEPYEPAHAVTRHRRLAAAPPHGPPPARGQQLPSPGRSTTSAPASQVCAHAPDGTIEAVHDPAACASASASSGTPSCSRTRPSTRRCCGELVAAAGAAAPALRLAA